MTIIQEILQKRTQYIPVYVVIKDGKVIHVTSVKEYALTFDNVVIREQVLEVVV